MRLISEIAHRHTGSPAIVIGGGPGALADLDILKKIPEFSRAAVISANGHGFKQDVFEVDYTVSVDWYFSNTRTRMVDHLAEHGKPCITRWSTASYRLPEWNMNADSGLTAMAVAYILGCGPIVPVGFDRYTGLKRYFWQKTPETGWDKRRPPTHINTQSNLRHAVRFLDGADVRLLSRGPLLEYFQPLFGPLGKPTVECAAPQRTLSGDMYRCNEPIFLHPQDRVDGGLIKLTVDEAKPFIKLRKISKV